MSSDREDALPSRHGIRSHYGMHSSKILADIQRRSSFSLIDLESSSLGSFNETWLAESSSQALKEFLIWSRNPIIDLVPTSPQRLSSCLRQRKKSQTRVISGHWLEGDITVPASGILALLSSQLKAGVVGVDFLVEL